MGPKKLTAEDAKSAENIQLKIRNPKHEIRNKFKCSKYKIQNEIPKRHREKSCVAVPATVKQPLNKFGG